MKKLLILSAGVMLLACNSNKPAETTEAAEKKVKYSDLVVENLKGNVESMTETAYKVDSTGKVGEMDSCCVDLVVYDENGNATSYVSKDSKGNIKTESVFTRHENGLWTGSKDTRDGKPSGGMQVEVDSTGKYGVARAFDSTGKMTVYYNTTATTDFGQVQAWKEYDKDSVFRQEWEATYDRQMMVSSVMKDSVGNVKNKWSAKYNEKGEQIETSNTRIQKDTTTTIKTYTYDTHDEMGNWTQRTEWNDKGKAAKAVKRTIVYRKSE
jgi:hypothetical protein